MTGIPLTRLLLVSLGCLIVIQDAEAQPNQENHLSARQTTAVAKAQKLAAKIDLLISARLEKNKIKPVARAEDSVFLRRLQLDLIGRIPTLLEVRDFMDDERPGKLPLWVERMLAGKEFPAHFARVWRAVMLPNSPNDVDDSAGYQRFKRWLEYSFKTNLPYSVLAKQALVGTGSGGGSNAFYSANGGTDEIMTSVTARVFLGIRLECAQCHDHPFAKWKRKHFWEMAAFFARRNAPFHLLRRLEKNGKVTEPLTIRIPGTKRVVRARFLDGAAPTKTATPHGPTLLADWITGKKNQYFAEAAVDHVWQRFFGASLLEPIRRIDKKSVKHPKLLNLLAREFTAHDFDLKYLIRAIVYSKSYQRSSKSNAKHKTESAYFARMRVRGLSPEQLFDSYLVATRLIDPERVNVGPAANLEDVRKEFLLKLYDPAGNAKKQLSILQALYFMNNRFLADSVNPKKSRLLRVLANSSGKPHRPIESLYLTVLSRRPRPNELKRLVPYIVKGGATGNRAQAYSDVYWALLNSAEFALNH